MPFHTDMSAVMAAFAGAEQRFDWLITDLDVLPGAAGLPPDLNPFDHDGVDRRFSNVLSGEALSNTFARFPVQCVWGVFSAFPRGRAPDPSALATYPCAETSSAAVRGNGPIQYPGAVAEIVCFDSTFTALVTDDAELIARFRGYFPETQVSDAGPPRD